MEQEGWTTPHAYGDTTTFGGFLYGNLIATEDDEMSQYIEAELDEKVIHSPASCIHWYKSAFAASTVAAK